MAGSILDQVDVHDAGDKIVLSCAEEATLRHVCEEMKKEGVRGIQAPVRVGHKWIASFEHPGLAQCTVERVGFEIIISGASQGAVVGRSHEFRQRGALVVRGPEQEDGVWKLYLEDVGGRTGHSIVG